MISRAVSETREERLARIRQEIAAGTYETPEKLEAAVDAFLQRQADDEAASRPGQPR
ncbi:MAG: hypothetical protein DWQ31_05255 [Planctomycetota bacterium]|nr:MAG: hypothetical protein DWQ31_05255 [Planctomycetota bacterium]REJ97597.1 MAG: hypothetical protein DWQ35_01665 [Planctomycetota bacterium]REK23019.1 MAG: hypothetical protein DWQ42_15965 [Planctomycetota bacterium]REK43382.1 MAG: hypothetical protein DWQ46_11665 [Planctomycetota bacterium]